MNNLPYRSDSKSSLPLSSERIVRTPVIRIESLTDKQGNTLMVTVSGCAINTDDEMIEYPASQVDNLDVAERFVQWLRKLGFEFQMVKCVSCI